MCNVNEYLNFMVKDLCGINVKLLCDSGYNIIINLDSQNKVDDNKTTFEFEGLANYKLNSEPIGEVNLEVLNEN